MTSPAYSEIPVLTTVALKSPGFISETKNYHNIQLFTLTTANREEVVLEILEVLSFLKRG